MTVINKGNRITDVKNVGGDIIVEKSNAKGTIILKRPEHNNPFPNLLLVGYQYLSSDKDFLSLKP